LKSSLAHQNEGDAVGEAPFLISTLSHRPEGSPDFAAAQ
jgi:hypothetical protein